MTPGVQLTRFDVGGNAAVEPGSWSAYGVIAPGYPLIWGAGRRCTYDPATRGGDAQDGRKVKGTLHWVSAAVDAEVRLYDRLFTHETPGAGDADFLTQISPTALDVVTGCKLEPSLASPAAGARYQFERLGYFCADPDGAPGRPVFNRTVTLKDGYK